MPARSAFAGRRFRLGRRRHPALDRAMPHSSHRRRHHSSRDAELWIHRVAVWSLLVLVGFLLGALYARFVPSPAGLLVVGAVLAVATLAGLSYFIGRIAAAVRNVCALHSAHLDLARFMRTNETFRAARRGVSRPKS